jgi:hypothetical protein
MNSIPFETLFESIDLQERSNYLKQLLESSSSLKSAFLSTYNKQCEEVRLQAKAVYNKDETLKEIRELADELTETLEELDFEEPDWERWKNNSGHYMDDYEIAAMLAEEEAEEVFEPYVAKFKDNLLHANFYDIAANISMLMHGILKADINDPSNNLGDPANDYFIDALHTIVTHNLIEFQRRKFLAEDYAYGFDIILIISHDQQEEDDGFIRAMTPFLISAVNNRETASILWSLISAYKINLQKVPKLLNHVTAKLENEKLWLQNMEATFLEDYETSQLLMDYYYKHNQAMFEEKAILFADRYTHNSTDYLIDKIKKGTKLHIELLRKKAGSGSDSRFYNELKKYLDKASLAQFILSVRDNNTKAKLLGIEKMYDELESLIRKEMNNNFGYVFFDFTNSVKPFFEAKPDLAFELISLNVNYLMKRERNRNSYNQIARLLGESLSIKGKKNNVMDIVNTLYYQQKPPLPALKDELRKAGLISKETTK